MNFSEFIMHVIWSTDDCSTQPKKPKVPSATDRTQQKQRKQLILIDIKNILICYFQQRQRLQPNFPTNSIKFFIHSKHKGSNLKLRIFLLILQRQHIQPIFMTDSIQNFICNKHKGAMKIKNILIHITTTTISVYDW